MLTAAIHNSGFYSKQTALEEHFLPNYFESVPRQIFRKSLPTERTMAQQKADFAVFKEMVKGIRPNWVKEKNTSDGNPA